MEVKEVNAEVLEQDEIIAEVFYQAVIKYENKEVGILHRIYQTRREALDGIAKSKAKTGARWYLIKVDLRENVKPPATPTPSGGKRLTEAKD